MTNKVNVTSARDFLRQSFMPYFPEINGDNIYSGIKGSRCLVSPFAFEFKKVVTFVNKHKYVLWLHYCYAERTDIDTFKALALKVLSDVKSQINTLSGDKLKKVSLLILPALIDRRCFYLTGKSKFTASDICSVIGIDEKNNHWHRDYKKYWLAILSAIEQMDSLALSQLDDYIYQEGLYKKWHLNNL